jgi:hypothetical protein
MLVQSKTVGKSSDGVVITEDSTNNLRIILLEAMSKEDLLTYPALQIRGFDPVYQ